MPKLSRHLTAAHDYLATLPTTKLILWCYLIWYGVTAVHYFDPTPSIWVNALGISFIIGIALVLSVGGRGTLDRWQVFRLFLMPFCVSSFSSLIKGHGFFLVVPPSLVELAQSLAACAAFVALVSVFRWRGRRALGPVGGGS